MEYYKHGDFIQPLIVGRVNGRYVLKGPFEQFCAAQELNITECLCSIDS